MHLLKRENLSTGVRRGHFETSEQDEARANVEAKWKPGGDGQDQKSPIRLLLACSGLARTPLALPSEPVSRSETCALAFQRTPGAADRRGEVG